MSLVNSGHDETSPAKDSADRLAAMIELNHSVPAFEEVLYADLNAGKPKKSQALTTHDICTYSPDEKQIIDPCKVFSKPRFTGNNHVLDINVERARRLSQIYDDPTASLEEAIEAGDPSRILSCITAGAELNSHSGPFNGFPLLWAMNCGRRSVDIIELLLEHGADPNFATPDGYTALHDVAAYIYGEEDAETLNALIGKLVEAGANIHARDDKGWTPLLRAIFEGSTTEVSALLSFGANPNDAIPADGRPEHLKGQTAAMLAMNSSVKLELLLDKGADPMAEMPNGNTAWDVLTEKSTRVKRARSFLTRSQRAMRDRQLEDINRVRELLEDAWWD